MSEMIDDEMSNAGSNDMCVDHTAEKKEIIIAAEAEWSGLTPEEYVEEYGEPSIQGNGRWLMCNDQALFKMFVDKLRKGLEASK